MDKKKSSSGKTSGNATVGFDPRKYWRSFEHLSLEVLSLVLNKREPSYDLIDRKVTQQTRDHGVDGYIRFRVAGSYREYTVESKLRAGNSISLRDIATSILYFLIGFGDCHYIVTNVIFTAEALRVIETLRLRTGTSLETIDGYELRRLINEGLSCQDKKVSELISLLREQPLPPRAPTAPHEAIRCRIIKENLAVAKRVSLRDEVIRQLIVGEKLFFVRGEPGTGKSQLIWDVSKEAEKHHFEICRIDLSKLYSPRVFVLQTLQLVLGLNLNDLLDQLDVAEREQLGQDPSLLECAAGGDYGRAIRYLLTLAEDHKENKNYLLRCLLSELSERCFHQTRGLLLIEGLDNSEWEMVQYLRYVLDILAGERSGLSVIIELPIFRNSSEAGKIPFNDWRELVDNMQRIKVGGMYPRIIHLENFSEYEARDVLEKSIHLPHIPAYYENAILAKTGTNPRALFSAVSLINAQRLSTLYDIERLPLSDGSSLYCAYIDTLLENQRTGIYMRQALAVLYELEGNLPMPLHMQLETEHAVPPGALAKTGLVLENPTTICVENHQILEALHQVLDMGTIQAARKWLIGHLSQAGWHEPYEGGMELLLKLRLHAPVSDSIVESTLSKLREREMGREADKILLEAYRVKKQQKQLRPALNYLLRYLERPKLRDKLNTPEYQELLSESDRLAASLASADVLLTIPLRIKLYFLHYWQCKSRYDYEGCTQYTEKILEMERECTGSESEQGLERYFILAHTFRALNFKEQGNCQLCVRAFHDALRRYPQSVELRISCYMNVAAFFYHTAPWIANSFLDQALAIVESRGGKGDNKWLWLYNDRILCDLYKGIGDLAVIEKARERADKQYSLSNLARVFGFIGCMYFDQGDMCSARQFFEKAVQLGTTQGGNKLSFLFLTNVIAIKLLSGEDAALEMDQACQWLLCHFSTVEGKISRNRRRGVDHLFAAVTSWVNSVQRAHRTDIEEPFRLRWEAESCQPYSIFQISNIHRDFLRGEAIVVLF